MIAAADAATATDDLTTKIVLLVIGAAIGFAFTLASDRIRARREPKKRLSFDLSVGATLASVPDVLAQKVSVTFGDAPVHGQLFEATCAVDNTGNQVVKEQYLRLSFGEGAKVLDAFYLEPPPPEYGVTDETPPDAPAGDHRWKIAHLEVGQRVAFGLLVSAPTPAPPAIHGYNEEGGVELTSRTVTAIEDDAGHVRPLVVILMLAWLLPAIPLVIFGDILNQGLRMALLILALPHIRPVAHLIGRRAKSWGEQQPPADLSINNTRAERLYVAGKGGSIYLEGGSGSETSQQLPAQGRLSGDGSEAE